MKKPSILARRSCAALAAFLLGIVPATMRAEHFVNHDSPLIPDGLRPGDSFHLVFVTGNAYNRLSEPTTHPANINYFNALVNTAADGSSISGLGAPNWFAIVSTRSADAVPVVVHAVNNAVVSAPVYRVDGVRVASGSADMWDGAIGAPINVNQNGTTTASEVWSGCQPYTGNGLASAAYALGGGVASTTGNSPEAGSIWLANGDHTRRPPDQARCYYALSEVITIQPPPDADSDGLPDWFELSFTQPSSATTLNPNDDDDQDGLTNLQEYNLDTRLDPTEHDTDNDGLLDGANIVLTSSDPRYAAWAAGGIAFSDNGAQRTFRGETTMGTDPINPDSDGDGLRDGVESNTGVWVSATNTGTNPLKADTDGDGLRDNIETNTRAFVNRTTDTGTSPLLANTDGDGAGDWYEVTASFTNPNSPGEAPSIPYPLPDPDGLPGATNKPVKVYILAGQSNMVGMGFVAGPKPGSLDAITRFDGKFPNLINASGNYLSRQDVWYEGVYTATAKKWLAPGCGSDSGRIGPELGFGHVMGWYHDEPVLIIKASQGNRGLGWDILPPGSPRFPWGTNTYAGYGDPQGSWPTGEEPGPGVWYGGKEFDQFFKHETDWAMPVSNPNTFFNVTDVLDNFANYFNSPAPNGKGMNWAAQGFEIAGFAWFQGHWDQQEPYATRYEQNLERLIVQLRAYYENRYPGKVVTNAPFAVASIGFGGTPYVVGTPSYKVHAAQLAVGDPLKYPAFAGNVKSVDTLPYWRALNESPGDQGYHYNNNAETYTLVGDALGRLMVDMLEGDDTFPPTPIPMSFLIPPSALNATTLVMTATTASDRSGPVEYFFECTAGGGPNSAWQPSPSFTVSGLTPGTTLAYRVKARDAIGNETGWSAELGATAAADGTAPSPNPMTFASPPAATGQTSLRMTATTASDINGVEYFFDCTVGGGPDSGWQSNPVFNATGLSPATQYTYVVRARDSVGNTTANSAPASATTDAPNIIPLIANPNFDPPAENLGDNATWPGYGPISAWTRSGAASGVNDSSLPFLNPQAAHSGTHVAFIQGSANISQNLTGYDPSKRYTVTYFVSERGLAGAATSTSLSLDGGTTSFPEPGSILRTAKFRRIVSGPLAVSGVSSTLRIAAAGLAGDSTLLVDTVRISRAVPSVPDNGFENPVQPGTGTAGFKFGNGGGSGTLAGSLWNFAGSSNGIVRNGSSYTTIPLEYAPEGSQAAILLGVGEFRTTVVGFEPGVTYSLSFAALGRSGSLGPNTVRVQLGDQILEFSGANSVAPGQAAWATFTTDPFITAGGNLELKFIGLTAGDKSTFLDDVRFNFVAEAVVNNPTFADYISNPAFGLALANQGFGLDPDGDNLANGLEAWLGTHPGEFNTGLVGVTRSGNTITFTHPHNANPPNDISGFYEWSPNLVDWYAGDGVDGPPGGPTVTIMSESTDTNTTVTATSSLPVGRVFLRAGVNRD